MLGEKMIGRDAMLIIQMKKKSNNVDINSVFK